MRHPRAATPGAMVLFAVALGASPVWSQEHEPPESDTEEHQAAHDPTEEHDEAGGHGLHYRNALGLVLGGTYESEEKDTFFTVGLEYERLFNEQFAILLGVEHITDVDAWLFVAPLAYRHDSGLRLFAGPGLELKTRRPHQEEEAGHGESAEGEAGTTENTEGSGSGERENLFLMRFGAGYNFALGERFTLLPALNLDLVREEGHWVEALVFTVTLGFEF